MRVVVVDNQSNDGSVSAIRMWLERNDKDAKVLLIEAPHNRGFASGNNIGIRAVEADNYLLLNSDTLIRVGAIETLMNATREYPEMGLFSPRLEWPDGTGQESCFRFQTPFSEFIAASKTRLIGHILRRFVVAQPVQSESFRPDWTSFACVLIRSQVFDSVGLLDEGYFMYFEDAEFCYRARNNGWNILHDPRARVVHLRGGSSPVKKNAQQRKRLPRYFYESRTRFFFQLYGRFGLTAANLMWLIGRAVSKTRQIAGRSDKGAIKGQWRDIWINWRNPLAPYTHPGR